MQDLTAGDSEDITRDWLPESAEGDSDSRRRGNADASGVVPARVGEPVVREIGRFGLIEKLATGAMGEVWRAVHLKLQKPLALKLLKADRMTDEEAVARFRQDIRLASQLSHPNVVRFESAGEVDGTHYLAMELVNGINLEQLAQRCAPMPVAETCQIVGQAAVGLEYAWRAGLVHRCVKPADVMLTPSGTVKVLDFGLAQLARIDGEFSGKRFRELAAFEYVAPELSVVGREIDARADVYSLGCILFRLLVGRPPYAIRFHQTLQKLMTAHAVAPIPRLGECREGTPAALDSLVKRMMAKDLADRPLSPASVATSLAALAEGSDVRGLLHREGSIAVDGPPNSVDTSTAEYIRFAVKDKPAVLRPSTTTNAADRTTESLEPIEASVRQWERDSRRMLYLIVALSTVIFGSLVLGIVWWLMWR